MIQLNELTARQGSTCDKLVHLAVGAFNLFGSGLDFTAANRLVRAIKSLLHVRIDILKIFLILIIFLNSLIDRRLLFEDLTLEIDLTLFASALKQMALHGGLVSVRTLLRLCVA